MPQFSLIKGKSSLEGKLKSRHISLAANKQSLVTNKQNNFQIITHCARAGVLLVYVGLYVYRAPYYSKFV